MEHLAVRRKVAIMLSVMSVMLFAALNMTIVGTSLPKIISDIGGMEYFNWVFTIYMLTSSITAVLVGKLSDIYGRKIFILTGICVFIIGSLLCGFSTTIMQLILFRGLAGFGGGMIMSTAFATVGDLFSARERGRWQGLMGAVFGLSSLFGPTLGGYIVDNMHWSWVFWIFLPVGVVAFFMIFKLYPQVERKEKEKIDYFGSLLLSVFIFSLLLGFSWAGTEYAWSSAPIIGLFSLSFIALISFLYVQSKVASPVVPIHLFKNRVVSISYIVLFLSGMGMFGLIMYVPFYVQGVLGESATMSGLVEMVMTIAMVLASAISGQLITKTGKYKILALVGFFIMAGGIFLNANLTPDAEISTIIFNLVISGIGLGMTMPIFMLTAQNAVEHRFLGVVTATGQLCRQLGGTIGVAIMGFVMSMKMTDKLLETQNNIPSLPNEAIGGEDLLNPQLLMNSDALRAIKESLHAQEQHDFEQFIILLRDALNYSLTQVFLLSAVIIVLAFMFTLLLKEIPLRTSNESKPAVELSNKEIS